jgi:2,3-bisphosphoglycerate-dependent phosphoglycerate mutase
MNSKLILLRHGRSSWNKQNLFTGWVDVPLDGGGVSEAIEAGKMMQHLPLDIVYTSKLIRAQMTVALSLMNHSSGKVPVFLDPGHVKQEKWSHIYSEKTLQSTMPVHRAWELNERYYGELQGLDKAETVKKFGEEQVHLWRRSFAVRPPEGESLEDTAARTLPFFERQIVPHMQRGETVLIVAHGNSLRSIIMSIEDLSEEEIVSLELPTGQPILYSYEEGTWQKSS